MTDMFPHYESYRIATRYQDLLAEAQEARLARQATAHQNTLLSHVFARLGDLMISTGVNLKKRYQRTTAPVSMPFLPSGQRLEF